MKNKNVLPLVRPDFPLAAPEPLSTLTCPSPTMTSRGCKQAGCLLYMVGRTLGKSQEQMQWGLMWWSEEDLPSVPHFLPALEKVPATTELAA